MEGHNLKPLSQIYQILEKRGITKELCMNDENQMVLEHGEKIYQPEDLCIVKTYRFEGDSNPDDNAVLYLLEDKNGEILTLLDAYGAESNYCGAAFDDFLRSVPIQERDEFNFD